ALGARAGEQRRDVEASDVLGGDIERRRASILRSTEVEHLREVRMREAHGPLYVLEERRNEAFVRRELRDHSLDDERLLEPLDAEALRAMRFHRAAAADELEELVSTDGPSRKARAHDWN